MSSSPLVNRLRRAGFTIADKSALVASSPELARKMQAELKSRGIAIQVRDAGRDVGADFGVGRRRRITLQHSRLRNVRSGIKTVLKLNATTKEARKLVLTSVAPRAWGFSVMGPSPTMMKTMNSLVVKGLDIRKFGGCNATMQWPWQQGPIGHT